MYDLIIVGAGPAGMSAGIYAARAKLNFIILEKVCPGGKLAWIEKIENYPGCVDEISGQNLAEKMYQQSVKFGANIKFEGVRKIEVENDIKKVITEKNVYETKIVIVASGSLLKKAGIAGEDRLSGKGVSYCAVCDGCFFKNKKVAVVGEGTFALSEVKFLKTLAAEVIWVKKRKDSFPEIPDVNVVYGQVKEIKGTQKVESMLLENSESGVIEEVSIDGIFIFSGFKPSSDFLPQDVIKRDKAGFIIADESLQTSVNGIYACGDIRADSMKQIVAACAEGAPGCRRIQKVFIVILMNKIHTEVYPFIEPWKVFLSLKDVRGISFLDSGQNNSGGRFSLLAWQPFASFSFENGRSLYCQEGKNIQKDNSPLKFFSELIKEYSVERRHFFSPGAIGIFSYDFAGNFEKIPDTKPDDIKIPECFFLFYDRVLVFDHFDKKTYLFVSDTVNKKDFSSYIKQSEVEVLSLLKKSSDIVNLPHFTSPAKTVYSDMDKDYYISSIKKIKEYIKKGDVYQINFAHHIKGEINCCPKQVYLNLRQTNPTDYAGYFDAGGFTLLSNSPELLIKKEGREIITRPMKGTRKRTNFSAVNEKMKKELLESKKEKAELLMIVDLERNDLGRICEYGSVKVRRFPVLEEYKTVFQMTGEIEGVLKKKADGLEILKSVFPSGSVTGAPKIRAMEIIEELEPKKRSFYTGSFGFLGFNKNIELNILIRSMLLKSQKFWYPVGGGIVWDSSPAKEYEETIVKAKNLFLALGNNRLADKNKNGKKMYI